MEWTGEQYVDRSDAVDRAKAWWSSLTRSDDPASAPRTPDSSADADDDATLDPRAGLSELLVELAGVLDNGRGDRSVSTEIGTALSRLRLPDRDALTRSAEWIGSVSASSRKQGLDFLRSHGAAMIESFGNGYATSSQRREQHARIDEDRFRLVFDNAAVAITIGDTEGRIVDANPALSTMLSIPAAELRGRHVFALVHADDQATIQQRIYGDLVTAREGTARIEVRLRRGDGTYSWTQFR